MKFTFAAACLLIVTLADQKFTLADDRGLDKNNVTTADIRDDINGFRSDWNLDYTLGITNDIEDGEGWQIVNFQYPTDIQLQISKKDLYDETIFKGSNGVVFNVGVVAGAWPYNNDDDYAFFLRVWCADGTVIEQSNKGKPAELKNIRLEADTTSCDITDVRVDMQGRSLEKDVDRTGTIWKDMDLYVWNDSVVREMISGLNQTHGNEAYVWNNKDGYKVEPEHCFEPVWVTSEQTVEFVAYSSTPANIDKAHYFAADIELYTMTEDGELELVANSVSAEAVGGAKLANLTTLFYDQKVDKDTFYQLCFVWDHPEGEDNEFKAQAGSYRYGYSIYG